MFVALCLGLVAITTSPTHAADGRVAVIEHQTEAVPGWPWVHGTERPSANLGGVIGIALLRSYEDSPDPATWVTLTQYAHHLRSYYHPGDRLPFKADIELLVGLEDAGLVEDGRKWAAALFERVRRISPSGYAEYQRIAAGRARVPEVIGYDIALAIRAALAVGELAYADELANAAIAGERLNLRDANDAFQVTSVGALLEALGRLGRPKDLAVRTTAARALMQAQGKNGAWAQNDTQATAYAVVGLTVTPTVGAAASAAGTGRQWLIRRQLKSGAWPSYHDGLPEPFVGPIIPLVEVEVLLAVM